MGIAPRPWQRKSTGAWFVQIAKKKVYLGKNKREAFAKYHAIMHRKQTPTTYTVGQIVSFYLLWLESNRAAETAASRKGILEDFVEYVPVKLKADAIKPHHVQSWIDDNKRIKSPTTANYRIGLIKGVFSWAKRMGHLDENPLADMPRPRCKVRQDVLPVDVWPKLLKLCTDEPFKYFITVMLATGCRVQDMFKFEAKHFNGHALVLPIEDSKGNRSSNVIYLPKEALSIVKYLAVVENPEGPLFRNSKGEPWNRNSVRMRFRRLKRELKMPGLCATTLRHSFAHYRLTQGQDSLTVSKLLNHADGRMLATRYGHLDQAKDFMLAAANAVPFPTMPDTPTAAG